MKNKGTSSFVEIFTEGSVSLPYLTMDTQFFKKIVTGIVDKLELENVSITLILTDDEFIHEINNDYRQKDIPTDVISFAYRENPFPGIEEECEELGDIYISLERALEQSKEYKVSFEKELIRLMVHGILHLIGYDHENSEEEAREMERKEDELLSSLC